MSITLNEGNYFSVEANKEYMSVSQFKDFSGTYGFPGCEEAAMAKMNGKYEEPSSDALLIGSYVDSYFEGTLDRFKDKHPELFTKGGTLYAKYAHADEMIKRVEQDEVFMAYMSGEKQVIMEGELFGTKWKIKIDSYLPDTGIVDLKVMKTLTEPKWIRDVGYLDFIRYWGYDIQGAVYQEIVRQNTGKRLPFFIAGISKEKVTNFEVIHVNDVYLDEAMKTVEFNIAHILDVKHGKVEPIRCNKCGYCISTKKLTGAIGIPDLLEAV